MAEGGDLKALRNMIDEPDTILETTMLADLLLTEQPAALGKKGGLTTAERGQEYFARIALMRKSVRAAELPKKYPHRYLTARPETNPLGDTPSDGIKPHRSCVDNSRIVRLTPRILRVCFHHTIAICLEILLKFVVKALAIQKKTEPVLKNCPRLIRKKALFGLVEPWFNAGSRDGLEVF